MITMKKRFVIFDWGNTLMTDFNLPGAMCDWETVEAVAGAVEVCKELSQRYTLVIATNGSVSGAGEVKKALARVGLDTYFTKIYAQKDIGFGKPDKRLFDHIMKDLSAIPGECVMIGDNLEKDVHGALQYGIDALWFDRDSSVTVPDSVVCFHHLTEIKDHI